MTILKPANGLFLSLTLGFCLSLMTGLTSCTKAQKQYKVPDAIEQNPDPKLNLLPNKSPDTATNPEAGVVDGRFYQPDQETIDKRNTEISKFDIVLGVGMGSPDGEMIRRTMTQEEIESITGAPASTWTSGGREYTYYDSKILIIWNDETRKPALMVPITGYLGSLTLPDGNKTELGKSLSAYKDPENGFEPLAIALYKQAQQNVGDAETKDENCIETGHCYVYTGDVNSVLVLNNYGVLLIRNEDSTVLEIRIVSRELDRGNLVGDADLIQGKVHLPTGEVLGLGNSWGDLVKAGQISPTDEDYLNGTSQFGVNISGGYIGLSKRIADATYINPDEGEVVRVMGFDSTYRNQILLGGLAMVADVGPALADLKALGPNSIAVKLMHPELNARYEQFAALFQPAENGTVPGIIGKIQEAYIQSMGDMNIETMTTIEDLTRALASLPEKHHQALERLTTCYLSSAFNPEMELNDACTIEQDLDPDHVVLSQLTPLLRTVTDGIYRDYVAAIVENKTKLGLMYEDEAYTSALEQASNLEVDIEPTWLPIATNMANAPILKPVYESKLFNIALINGIANRAAKAYQDMYPHKAIFRNKVWDRFSAERRPRYGTSVAAIDKNGEASFGMEFVKNTGSNQLTFYMYHFTRDGISPAVYNSIQNSTIDLTQGFNLDGVGLGTEIKIEQVDQIKKEATAQLPAGPIRTVYDDKAVVTLPIQGGDRPYRNTTFMKIDGPASTLYLTPKAEEGMYTVAGLSFGSSIVDKTETPLIDIVGMPCGLKFGMKDTEVLDILFANNCGHMIDPDHLIDRQLGEVYFPDLGIKVYFSDRVLDSILIHQ